MMLSKIFRRGLSCHEVMEVLQSYLDGETDAETARQVVAHLDRCRRCEAESEVYRRIKATLAHRAPDIDPDVLAALNQFGQQVARGELD